MENKDAVLADLEHVGALLEMAEEEVEDAEEYLDEARKYKRKHKHVGDKCCALCEAELKHADELLRLAENELEAYKREYGELPVAESAVFDYRLDTLGDDMDDVRRDVAVYKSC